MKAHRYASLTRMSVVPSGSPPDTRKTTLNMLNVQTLPRITAGSIEGRSSGTVTFQKRCQRVAPSTSAASITSFEMLVRAPSVMTIMKGKPSHVLVATFAANAVEKCENQLTGSAPRAERMALMAPNCRWNMPFQASAVT